jgi:uncharacterized hydrophobic protein (TIGR00271 family)
MLVLFDTLTGKDKSSAIDRLIKGSTPNQDFFFMIILSIITATFGLLLNNVAIIIGSMLIAPILYPILSLSLGFVMSDGKLVYRALYTIIKAVMLAIIASTVVAILFSNQYPGITNEIIERSHTSFAYVIIAVVAGLAGSFALVKPQLNETLPGIAISVSVIPPLAAIGVGVAELNWIIISGASLLFFVNAIGIVISGMLTFSLMNFYVKRKEAHQIAAKEDLKVKHTIETAENKNKG